MHTRVTRASVSSNLLEMYCCNTIIIKCIEIFSYCTFEQNYKLHTVANDERCQDQMGSMHLLKISTARDLLIQCVCKRAEAWQLYFAAVVEARPDAALELLACVV